MKTATVYQLRPKLRAVCSECGMKAACECNAPYVTAAEYAAIAIERNPNKSNRAIAAECGVAEGTVRNVRKAGAQNYAPEKRVGVDGKKYPATQPHKEPAPRA